MAFSEARLSDLVSYGFEGGPSYSTRIRTLLSGHERRMRRWAGPRWSYKVPYSRLSLEVYREIHAAFLAQGGMADGFRFKDWADYSAVEEVLGEAPSGSDPVQLTKNYNFGSNEYVRAILKPVEDTVVVYEDSGSGPVVKPGTTDYATGLFTPDDPWTPASVVLADFEFDVPVRFDMDYLPWSYEGFRRLSAEISLIELRDP